MSLMSFWKKKPTDQITLPPLDNSSLLTDLPSIDGSIAGDDPLNAPSETTGASAQFPDNVPSLGNMQQLPSLDMQPVQQQFERQKGMSINLPTLDFSMPPPDDMSMIAAPPKPSEQTQNIRVSEPNVAPNTTIDVSTSSSNTNINFEDLNNLFVSDGWKEPDWATFEPYTEEKVDEPVPEDFKGTDLPKFDEADNANNELVVYPTEPFEQKPRTTTKPLELFIRGNAYNNVFTELDHMNKALTKIDMQFTAYEDIIKNEEPLLITAKEQMEYLYKRLNLIDKKIFAQ